MPEVAGDAARSARRPAGCATRTPSPASARRRPTAARPGGRRSRSDASPRAPSTRPARSSIGGMLSTPLMRPLAIDGAAPSTTTNRIASSVSLNRTIASGNHATDGIVCSPVIIEPTPARSTVTRATAMPTTPPITIASDEADDAPRCSVTQRRVRVSVAESLDRAASNTVNGDGSDVLGLPADHTTTCQTPTNDRDGEQLRPGRATRAARRSAAPARGARVVEPASRCRRGQCRDGHGGAPPRAAGR